MTDANLFMVEIMIEMAEVRKGVFVCGFYRYGKRI